MNIEEGKALNHLIRMEERLIRLLKSLEDQGEISEKEKNDLSDSNLSDSKPGVLYGLAKIHKALEDGIPSFRPIFSAIGTPTYKLAKFCDQLASFDIKSLFTNIPLTEMLNLCLQNLYRNQTHVGNLTKSSFYSLLKITMFESFFIFDGKFMNNVMA